MKRMIVSAAAIAAMLLILVLGSASLAFAENVHELVGKQVAGVTPLYINGIKSSQDAIIINQTSYIPVRAASTLFGYDVDYDAEKRRILLNKRPDPAAQREPDPSGQPARNQGQDENRNSGQGQGTQTGDGSSPTGTAPNSQIAPGYYTITEEDIRKELEMLAHMESIYDNIIQNLNKNISVMGGYSREVSEMLTKYHKKKQYVSMEIHLLNQLMDVRSKYEFYD